LNGTNFSDFSSRRPIFPAYLTTLLWICNKNLQVTMGIMVFFAAICTYLTVSGMHKYFSPFLVAQSLGISKNITAEICQVARPTLSDLVRF